MREFKFRAWHKENKQMHEVSSIKFDEKEVGYIYEMQIPEHNVEADEAFFDFDEVELMQYTGLKDCNKKEIYEGDIVKFWVDGYAKSRTAKVKFNTERGRWMLFASVGHHRDLTAEKASKCEIIGNIFENPELLLGGKND